MVNPLYLIALFLASAFAVALVDKLSRRFAIGFVYLAMAAVLAGSVWRLVELLGNPMLESQFFTAGFAPPLSIAIAFGMKEAILLILVNAMGLLVGISLARRFRQDGAQPMALFMLALLGANGIILTRDIFNAFVFLEILSIAGYALIAVRQTKASLISGLKYMMAGGITSFLLLIGIIFVYRYTGTLNIDMMISLGVVNVPGYHVALFLLLIALFVDLKPFPANGWALDVYQSTHGALGALFSSIHSTALIYLIYKLLPVVPSNMATMFAIAGLVSFVLSNLIGIRQNDAKRLLGYSSVAQSGLIIFTLFGLTNLGLPDHYAFLIALGFMISNALAKSGMFWLSELVPGSKLSSWAVLRKDRGLLVAFGMFAIALVGLPPFPGFFAKWELVRVLAGMDQPYWMVAILLGSLFEAAYLLRWVGIVAKGDTEESPRLAWHLHIPVVMSVTALLVVSYYIMTRLFFLPFHNLLPIYGLIIFGLMDFIPVKIKGFLAMAALAAFGWFQVYPQLPQLGQIFAMVLIGGAVVQIFAFMNRKGAAEGIIPLLVMLVASLGNLLLASSRLEFFLAWELMTISSWLLIMRGREAREPAQNYIMFSLGAAYLILSALVLMPEFIPGYPILWQARFVGIPILPLVLGLIGVLIKTGSLGLHVWLPGAYTEADDDTSSIISSVLSKAGIFAMLLFLLLGFRTASETGILMDILGWAGVLTALAGALLAVFEEDAKRLLAYSSMSQLGYIVAGLSLMTHLGWMSAMYLTVNHMLFKALIFIAMAGVFYRTGTRQMYQMGGLIKKMPISYLSVLMGIIAVSGVPPLTGFGSKWFIYTSLLEHGRYLQAAVAFFSSAVAFLYLYKLIHTVFLGQAKPDQAHVKEAPVWFLVPQVVFIMAIMGFSMFPNMLTKPLSLALESFIAKPDWLSWSGYTIHMASPTLKGYWNGNLIMYVTMGVFIAPLIWLLLVNARAQKVKQFNIVYAAERPYKPWTTHFAYNMFAHYQKALGWWVQPRLSNMWKGVGEWAYSLSATLARLYTGNGQTYLLHIFLYVLVLYLALGVRI